jgi:hypothetical protein
VWDRAVDAWNRRYAWGLSGPSSWRRQVVPFCVLSIVGLVVSTGAVAVIARVGAGWTAVVRGIALPVGNLSVFASLWLVQFLVLDCVLFARRADARNARARMEAALAEGPPRTSPVHCSDAGDVIATGVSS